MDAGTAYFKLNAKLEKAFILTHQLSQTHLCLDSKHLRPLSIIHTYSTHMYRSIGQKIKNSKIMVDVLRKSNE